MTSIDDLRAVRTPGRITAALMIGSLTVSLTSTLGTPLIPTIARSQGVSLQTAQWLLTITLLVGAVMTPVLGRLGDGSQRVRLLQITLGSVVVGSLVAGTADNFTQLLVGRAIQGIGYATVPLCIALARELLAGEQQRRAIAALSITVAVGAGLGFPVTGLIAEYADYHAAFLFAAFFGAVAIILVRRHVPPSTAASVPVQLDWVGAILLGIGLSSLLVAISKGSTWGWGQPSTLGLTLLGLAVMGVWGVVELRTPHALVDLRLSAQRSVLGPNLTAVLVGVGMYQGLGLVNRLAQTPTSEGYGFAASLVVTGLVLLPLSLGSVVSQPLARAIGKRFSMRVVLASGCVVVGLALAYTAGNHDHLGQLALLSVLLGIGVGTTFAAMPALIVATVPEHRTGSAMSLNQVLRTVGGALGSALSATVLAAHTPAGMHFPDEGAYTIAFGIGALACLAALVVTLAVVPSSTTVERMAAEDIDLLMEESGAGAGVGPSMFDGEDDQ
ncbi:MAG: MFS transporter [Actinobacteria bacterium]|nr:MFS transporter [Actinomycetota bacterium]